MRGTMIAAGLGLVAAGAVWWVLGRSPSERGRTPAPDASTARVMPDAAVDAGAEADAVESAGRLVAPAPAPRAVAADPEQAAADARLAREVRERIATRAPGFRPEEPVARPPPPPLPPAPPPLSHEVVKSAVQSAKPVVSECYEKALGRRPGLGGKLTVQFTVVREGGAGRLNDATIVVSDAPDALVDPVLELCVLAALAEVSYPSPGEDGALKISYPFVLQPGPTGAGE